MYQVRANKSMGKMYGKMNYNQAIIITIEKNRIKLKQDLFENNQKINITFIQFSTIYHSDQIYHEPRTRWKAPVSMLIL